MSSTTTIDNRSKTSRLLTQIKANNEDNEWYPTTNEMINIIKRDLEDVYNISSRSRDGIEKEEKRIFKSALDIGAGDGRVLKAITHGKKYAIEKSKILQQAMPADIFIIGTDFDTQTLIDKPTNFIFCNPPYSCFANWMIKIIREANCEFAYMIVPHRWENNPDIHNELEHRRAKVKKLGLVDFKTADRKARAIVDILRVDFITIRDHYYYSNSENGIKSPNVSPFTKWFEDSFKFEKTDSMAQMKANVAMNTEANEATDNQKNELISSTGIVKTLEQFYNKDMTNILNTYQNLAEIDQSLLNELEIKIDTVKETLRMKIAGKKKEYWKKLFNELSDITEKLTSHSRQHLLDEMQENMSIDFTANNAYAVCMWVLKHCNDYYDNQLLNTVEMIYSPKSVINYISNEKTLSSDHWKYNQPKYHDHYKLDYRLVCDGLGGFCDGTYRYTNNSCGLQQRSVDNLNDIITVANNLGFLQDENCPKAQDFTWTRNNKYEFKFKEIDTDTYQTLMTVRAYQNGNFWINFNQKFMQRLNVEFGRLKGWVRSPQEAAEEMQFNIKDVEAMFNCNIQLTAKNMPLTLGYNTESN